ncbi:MAG TPA: hypothetical protein VFV94_05480, partial [Polyangiaceae bacterium]|nr:hypothetical protein [Polyangiaceae bacterium]
MRPGTAIVVSVLLHALAVLGLSLGRLPQHPPQNAPPAFVWVTLPPPARPAIPESPPAQDAPDERPTRARPPERPAARAEPPP